MFWLAPSILVSTNKPTCENIFDFAKGLTTKTDLKVGIFSNKASWTKTFGTATACPELMNLPLFNYEVGQPSPASFGAWSRWEFQYLQTNHICNNDIVEIKQNK